MKLFKDLMGRLSRLWMRLFPKKYVLPPPHTYTVSDLEPVKGKPFLTRKHGRGGHPRHAAMVPLKPWAKVGR